MKNIRAPFLLTLSSIVLFSCSSSSSTGGNTPNPDSGLFQPCGTIIPCDQIVSGGTGREGIPVLDNPTFTAAAAATYLTDESAVVGLNIEGDVRAYPHAILNWHEIIHDVVGGQDILISFCPLTGSPLVFHPRPAGFDLKFSGSGLLYLNNLIMVNTVESGPKVGRESLWSQMGREGLNGEFVRNKLNTIKHIETSWQAWQALYPNTQVLSEHTGFENSGRDPRVDPYVSYRASDELLYTQPSLDMRLPNKTRVHGVVSDEQNKAYPIESLGSSEVINDTVGGTPILLLADGPLNFIVSYNRRMGGNTLTFRLADNSSAFPFTIVDEETGSTWNLLGEAIAGQMAGAKLSRPFAHNAFWFGWSSFNPNGEIFTQ